MTTPQPQPAPKPIGRALPSMRILWGRKTDAPEWAEDILCTNPARFAEVRKLASADGFAHFRESVGDGSAPDFASTLRV